jgi:hypothetical protein
MTEEANIGCSLNSLLVKDKQTILIALTLYMFGTIGGQLLKVMRARNIISH